MSHQPAPGAWEYSITHSDLLSNVSGVPQISSIWRTKYADEATDWDHLQRMGREGWELVSAFPVMADGTTLYVTFIFRRPAVANSSAEPTEDR
jgi:hypothetical protein